MNHKELLDKFDFFEKLPEDERRSLLGSVSYRDISAGTYIISENMSCPGVTLVLSGEIRVFRVSESGREIMLYSVKGGETCVMTIACFIGLQSRLSPVSAVAVQDSHVAVIPTDKFRYVFSMSPYLQQFVFRNVVDKFYTMIDLVSGLTFKSVTDRLRDFLAESTGDGRKPLYTTHAQLAAKLGTSREVVTRRLRELEAEGFVRTERGKITLLRK